MERWGDAQTRRRGDGEMGSRKSRQNYEHILYNRIVYHSSTQPTDFRNLQLNTTAHQYLCRHILNLDVVGSIEQ